MRVFSDDYIFTFLTSVNSLHLLQNLLTCSLSPTSLVQGVSQAFSFSWSSLLILVS